MIRTRLYGLAYPGRQLPPEERLVLVFRSGRNTGASTERTTGRFLKNATEKALTVTRRSSREERCHADEWTASMIVREFPLADLDFLCFFIRRHIG